MTILLIIIIGIASLLQQEALSSVNKARGGQFYNLGNLKPNIESDSCYIRKEESKEEQLGLKKVKERFHLSLNKGGNLFWNYRCPAYFRFKGIEISYFREPRIGLGGVYNLYGSKDYNNSRRRWEDLKFKECGIWYLYRPTKSEDLIMKFGFKDFYYKKTCSNSFFEHSQSSVSSGNISGLWLGLTGSRTLPLVGDRVKLFVETGVTFGKNERLVEFSSSMVLQIFYSLKVKVGHHQVGLSSNKIYFSQPKVSIELTI